MALLGTIPGFLNFCEYYPLIKVLPSRFWPGAWVHASCPSPLLEASTTPSGLLALSCALSSMGDACPARSRPVEEWQGSRGQGRTALPVVVHPQKAEKPYSAWQQAALTSVLQHLTSSQPAKLNSFVPAVHVCVCVPACLGACK